LVGRLGGEVVRMVVSAMGRPFLLRRFPDFLLHPFVNDDA
jgi:hypothetical protein